MEGHMGYQCVFHYLGFVISLCRLELVSFSFIYLLKHDPFSQQLPVRIRFSDHFSSIASLITVIPTHASMMTSVGRVCV